jgi:PIN domain nuclease of toxin-antitoxin system
VPVEVRPGGFKLRDEYHVTINEWGIIPIDLDIMEEAFSLPGEFHADPVDRIIVATARRHGFSVVTADMKILSYPHVAVLWDRQY